MGMFDRIHYQGVAYQTKDTPSQALSEYEIRDDELWFKNVEYKWVSDEKDLLGGHLERVSEKWEHLDDFSGQVVFYDDKTDYLALFWEGKMIRFKELDT